MEYTLLILLLPLLSFLLIGVVDLDIPKNGRVWSPKVAGIIGTASLAAVTVLSYVAAFQYFTGERLPDDGTFPTIVPYNFTWLPLGSLHFDLGILLDPISVMMLVVISTVSLMVHIYSFGYMHGERGFQRYYAYLSLFTMSMLGLVLATNIFQMYMFWELVGVSSYLLIGFYYTAPAAIAASKKAFIVTRFADMFFLVGILVFGYFAHSFNFSFAGDVQMGAHAAPFIQVAVNPTVAAGAFIIPAALVLMLVARCHGRPHPRVGSHPRCDDGCGRCVPDRAYVPHVDGVCSLRPLDCGLGRCHYRILRGFCCLCAERHQARAGLLHDFANRLYDGRPRCLVARTRQ